MGYRDIFYYNDKLDVACVVLNALGENKKGPTMLNIKIKVRLIKRIIPATEVLQKAVTSFLVSREGKLLRDWQEQIAQARTISLQI